MLLKSSEFKRRMAAIAYMYTHTPQLLANVGQSIWNGCVTLTQNKESDVGSVCKKGLDTVMLGQVHIVADESENHHLRVKTTFQLLF